MTVGLFNTSAQAASFNIDFGITQPSNNSAFGAAANQSGTWNNITTLGTTSNLIDVTGTSTTVSLNLIAPSAGVNGSIPGRSDISNLIDDSFFTTFNGTWSLTLSGLSNGIYDIYYYAPTNTIIETGTFEVNGVSAASILGDNPNANDNELDQGLDWDIVSGVNVTDGSLTFISSTPTSNFRGLSGLQLTQVSQPVPEPLTILGAGTAIAFGGAFKRKLAKNSKKK